MADNNVITPPVIDVPHEKVEALDSSGNANKSDGVQRLDALFSAAEKVGGIKAAIESEKPAPEPKVEKPAPEPKVEKKEEPVTPPKTEEAPPPADAREALRRATEAKTAEPKTSEAKTPSEDDVSEDELTVLPHDKPKTAKRIQAILKRAEQANAVVATTKAELDAKAKRLAELEAELSKVKTVDPLQDERVKAQMEELAQYRRRYEIEKDPEFQTKFSGRETAAEESITGLLKAKGAQEWLLNTIKSEGGWLKFTQSARPVTMNTADGEVTVPASEFAEKILSALPFADRKAIEAASVEQIQLSRERSRYLDENTRKAAEYFKQREEEQLKQSEAYQKQLAESNRMIEEWQQQELTKNEYLKLKEVPADATPEQKAAIEEDNRYTKQLQDLHRKVTKTSDLPGLLEIAHDAVAYWAERRNTQRLTTQVEKLSSELKAKQQELDNYRKASRSVARTGSLAGSASAADGAAKKAPRTLEETLDMIERGDRPSEE